MEDRAIAIGDLHKNFVKIGLAVTEMRADRQTDTQTDRQTDRNAPLPHRGGVKMANYDWSIIMFCASAYCIKFHGRRLCIDVHTGYIVVVLECSVDQLSV